jgi:hypothetical protein
MVKVMCVEHRERRAKKQRKVKNEGKLSSVCFMQCFSFFHLNTVSIYQSYIIYIDCSWF